MNRLRLPAWPHRHLCAALLFLYGTTAHGQITEIVTDYNGFWKSGRPTISPTRPDNSHNLLAFRYRSIYYSTGVNNTVLTSNGISFTAGDYRALPIDNFPVSPGSNTYAGIGQLYDGVDNGSSNPPPANNLPFYLTDGLKGLNLGTAIYNLPTCNLPFAVSNFQTDKIGDSIPDIVITQMGDIGANDFDILYFSNASGDTIGNSIRTRFQGLDTLALGVFDFYAANANPMTLANNTSNTKSARAIRFYAADLSQFGISSANIANIKFFNHRLSGASDVAFVAYNAEAIRIQPDTKPGCLGTVPAIWIKAGEATNTITNGEAVNRWLERSPNAFSLVQATAAQQPKFRSGTNTGFNFNPFIDFDASNRLLSINSPFTAETNNADFYIVGRPSATATGKNKVVGFSKTAADGTAQGNFPELSYTGTGASMLNNANNGGTLSGNIAAAGFPYLWQATYTNGGSIRFFRNGAADGSGSTAGNVGNYAFQLGDAAPGDGSNSDFDVAEVLMYPQNLAGTQRNQIETYLAVKYGLPLAHDYVSGNGTTLWSLTANAGYNNNLFGIGREDCEGLHQKQSKSQAANALVTIGNTGIATENNTNFNTLTNLTYSLVGDNSGQLTWQTTEKPTNIETRIGREWRVRETGTVGNLLVQVPAATSTAAAKLPDAPACKLFMLVDNDGDFSSGTLAQVEMTLVGTAWEASYNFTDGNYFTFATENKDYGDLPTTGTTAWPAAAAGVVGCDVNKDGQYSRSDANGTKLLAWAGAAVTSEVTANSTNTDAADDGLQAANTVLVANASNQFNVLLNSNITGTRVYYRLWFDWNNDGNFANDNGLDLTGLTSVPATYAGSAVVTGSGPVTVPVLVRPPANFTLVYKTRLVVSTDTITDVYRNNGSSYVVALASGEVEDYNAIIILPVSLKSFSAVLQGCTVLAQWQTASEQGSSRFEVEQSTNGHSFTTIGSVAAKNMATGAAYQFLSGALPPGTSYLRLKMIDKDGKTAYSPIEKVSIACGKTTLVVSPNPVKDILYLSGLPTMAQLLISDATGRVLVSQKTGAASSRQISLQGWVPGIYQLQVWANGKLVETHKLLKTD